MVGKDEKNGRLENIYFPKPSTEIKKDEPKKPEIKPAVPKQILDPNIKKAKIASFPNSSIETKPTVSRQILKPNIKKSVLSVFLEVISITIGIIICLMLLKFLIPLDVFIEQIQMFGIDIVKITIIFIIALMGIAIISAGLNYLSIRNVKFEFLDDKIEINYSPFLFFISLKTIPYENISMVSHDKGGIFSILFKTGTVILELKGMKEKEIKLEWIDNSEQIAEYIKKLIARDAEIRKAKMNKPKSNIQIIDKGKGYINSKV